ncbi:hypothetical protein Bca52824_032404 [Brassica carinata]|uniref:Uncharacterized protein n=1 Tax=Brassica carinata TaxID=52824 RepID=A0A8X7SCP3_BRACI|nr:hypothetical protein Bca52824_032404 [Brassica carinata]
MERDTSRQGNGGRVFVRAKLNWDRDRHFSSLSFFLAAIERAILLSTAHLLRDGEVKFDHQDCISKEIKEKQPFPPQLKFSDSNGS